MPKRKKRRAPAKKTKNDTPESKVDEAPSPAKKIAAVSSTSQLEENQVSSCTILPVSNEAELQSDAPLSPSCFFCTCCNFSTGLRSMLDEHMQQHKLKCPWCPFSSLSHLEVIHHCRFKHDRSTEMDTVPCLSCMFCNFMTYIMEYLETHTALKHPDKQTRYVPKMISKQVSADLRRDDAVFYQTLANKNTKSVSIKLESGSHSGAKSNPILIDTAVDVAKEIKREAHSGSVSEMCARTADPCAKTADPSADSINKQTLVSYILSDIEASKELKIECRTVEAKFELRATEAARSELKLEKLYCLTCPYSSVSVDEVKYHTVGQHPVGAAAATYSLSGESVSQGDITFFCVKQSCTFSSFDCSSYQKHLTECCAFNNLLTVLETTRLKTTIMYILDYLKKYNLSHVDVFSQLASSYLGISLAGIQVHSPDSCKIASQIFVPPSNENVNRSSIASSDHSSPPVTIFSRVPPHNQQTSSVSLPVSYSQQGNIQTPYSDHVGTAQQLQGNPGVSSIHAANHLLGDARDQDVNILNTFSLSGVTSVSSSSMSSDVRIYSSSVSSSVPVNSSASLNIPTNANNHLSNVPLNSSSVPLVNSSSIPSDVRMYPSSVSFNVPENSSASVNLPANANNHLSNVPLNSNSVPSHVPIHANSVSSNIQVNSSNQPTNVPVISRHVLSNGPVNSSNVTANMPGNGSFLHPNQFPMNNVSNFLFDQTGNAKQQPATFTAGPTNQGTVASAHNFLQGTNTVSFASHHQPGVLINSGQCHVSTGSSVQTSLANNSAAFINHGTSNFSQTSNLVSHAVQQQPGILINSSQSHYVTNRHHQAFLASNSALHTNTGTLINSGDKSLIGGSNPVTDQSTTGNMNRTFPASQGCTIESRTVFGQQSGSLMTAGQNQGGLYQYNTIAGNAIRMQTGQSGIVTDTGLKQGASDSLTYAAPASQASLSYGHQAGNLIPASLNHGITGNQNQTIPHGTNPMVHQETYQTREHNVNSTVRETPAQQDASNANTILVFNMSNSDSRLHNAAYTNQSRLPPVSFYQAASLNTQNQVHTVSSVASAGQSAGLGRQAISTGMPSLHSTLPDNSVEQSSRSQFSSSSVNQTSQFTSQSDSVSSNVGMQTANGPGHNRTMYSAPCSTQVGMSVSTTSRSSPLEAAPTHQSQGMHALRSVSVHTGSRMATSPQLAHPIRPVIISSLPPSIHRQNPAVGKTNFRPRVPLPSGARPRRLPAPVASQSHRGRVAFPKQVGRGRGQTKSPRLLSGSPGASYNTVSSGDGNEDDDDVIVTGGFSPRDQQKPYQPQSGITGVRLPVSQPPSEFGHQERQASKAHEAVSSSQASRPPQSRKMVDVGSHFENIVCAMNTSDCVENIDAPEDDVEILSVETRSGRSQGTSVEVSQKTRPVDNQTATRTQNNSVGWNVMDSFSSALRDVYHGIANSSAKHPCKPPTNSQPSVRHTVPSRNELAEGNISSKQQSLARPSAYSEQRAMAIRVSPCQNPSAKNPQNRAGHMQVSPAVLSPTVTGHKQMQQRPSQAALSKVNSSKPLVLSPQHPSVIILDADSLTPSREINKNYSINKEPYQDVIVVDSDTPAVFGKTTKSCINREAPQDVIVLDADPSGRTETRDLKTSEPTDCVIILDADSSEKSVDKGKNSSVVKKHQAISIARPSHSLPSTRGNKAMSVNRNVNMRKIHTPQAHSLQHFTPASQGASFNSKVPPRHEQHSFTVSPAPRTASSSPVSARTASASPVSARTASASPVSSRTASASPVTVSHHPNSCPNNITTQRGPQPAFRGTNVQNRNGPRTVTNRPSTSGFSNSPVSTNVSASSISPISVSHSNQYSSITVTQKGPQSALRGTHFQDKNGPRTVSNAKFASGVSNSSANPVVSSASIVARSAGCSEKASISEMQIKTTQNTVMPCLSERSPTVTDSSSKDSSVNVKDHTQILINKSNQSKLPVNLPALLLAKFKMCANLNNLKTVPQQSADPNTSAGISKQSTSFDGSAEEANPCVRISTAQRGECSGKTGEVLSTPQPLPSPLKLPASSLSVCEDKATHEATALSGSSTITSLSAMDVEQIIILDLDINESESALPSVDSEQIFILDIDVNEQVAMQEQPENQQTLMLKASSDIEMTERNTQFSPVGDRTQATAPKNINLLNCAPVSENSTLAAVSATVCDRNSADCTTFQSDHVQNVQQKPPHLYSQLTDSPGTHSQLKNPAVLHNPLKDSPGLHHQLGGSQTVTNLEDSRTVSLLASCIDPQTVGCQKLQATNVGEPRLSSDCKELHADSQTVPTGGAAGSNSKVITKDGRKPKEGIKKKRGIDETGKSLLEKTKKQRIRKTVVNAEKESENKDSLVEERIVRHSDRLLKTVIKDLQKHDSDNDAPLSSGSEFPIDEEEFCDDSDSEWSDSPEKKIKVKQKKFVAPADPTAFNISLRGNYKCWLCRMVYSRCMYAKQHIVKKHFAGLCAIDIDRSKEANSVCLLLFCPRTCKYVTSTLEAMNCHLQTCNAPLLLKQGTRYVEVNRDFLDQKYNELLNLSLEAVLHPVTARQPRDPAKVPRVRKPKAALGAQTFSGQSYGTSPNVVPFPNTSSASSVPGTPLRLTAADRPVVSGASQNASFKGHNVPAEWPHQAGKHAGHGTIRPAAVRTQVSHQQRSRLPSPNSRLVNNSQLPMQHIVSPTSRLAVPKDIPPSSKLQHVHTRLLPSLRSPEQQFNKGSSSSPLIVTSSYHRNQPYRTDHSADHEDFCMVEDNGIICLE